MRCGVVRRGGQGTDGWCTIDTEKAALVAYLQKPPKTNLPTADQIVTLPVQKRNGSYSCHKFALCGVVFYLCVGGQVPDVCNVSRCHVLT
jgi:hypothetical protein